MLTSHGTGRARVGPLSGLGGLLATLAVLLAPVPAHTGSPDRDEGVSARLPVLGAVLRGFEPPTSPYGPGHRGVAIAAAPGEVVEAALDGRVAWSGPVAGTGWVTVDHGGGLVTTYGDVDPRAVTAGREVTAGDVLGRVAEEATHLHWGARLDDEYIDPLSLLGRWTPRLVPTSAEPLPTGSEGPEATENVRRSRAADRAERRSAGTVAADPPAR